jgi:alkaline phosphatase D
MTSMNRRTFVKRAVAMSATAAFGDLFRKPSRIPWQERRDFFSEGVASGDPADSSVLLWTRYGKPTTATSCELQAEVSEDRSFERVIATASMSVSAASDWTCRVLVGELKPRSVYWYRFVDAQGNGSRLGRTITAPSENEFAVSKIPQAR